MLGGVTKNVYDGIFQNSNGFTVLPDGIFRCSQHFLLAERGITSPFWIEKAAHVLQGCTLPPCLSKREV